MFRKLFRQNKQESGKGKGEGKFQQDDENLKPVNEELYKLNKQLRSELELSRQQEKRYLKLQIEHLLTVNKELSTDMDVLKKSNKTLLSELKAQNLQNAETRKRFEEMENEKKLLEHKEKTEKEILQMRNVQLMTDLQIQKAHQVSKEEENDLLRKELYKMVDGLKERTQENLTLQKDLGQAKRSLIQAEQLMKDVGDEFLRKNLELREQVKKLRNDLEESKTKCASMEKKTVLLEEKNQKLREQNAGLLEDVQALTFYEDAFDLKKNEIKLLEQQNKEGQEESLRHHNLNLNLKDQKLPDSLTDKTESEKLQQVSQRLQFLSTFNSIRKKNKHLQQQTEDLREQNQKLREDFQKVKHFEFTCDGMKNKMHLLKQQTKDLRAQNQKLREDFQNVKHYKSTCDGMKNKIYLLKQQTEVLREQNQKLGEDLNEQKDLESTCDVMRSNIISLQKQNEELREENHKLTEDLGSQKFDSTISKEHQITAKTKQVSRGNVGYCKDTNPAAFPCISAAQLGQINESLCRLLPRSN